MSPPSTLHAMQISDDEYDDCDAAGAGDDQDAFLGFVEYAGSTLSPEEEQHGRNGGGEEERRAPSWSWIVSRILKTCIAYSSGVTSAILLSDLFQAWSEQNRYTTSKKKLECMISLKQCHRRTKLPNTVTIDSVYEKNFLSPSSILEAVVLNAFLLPGTNIYMLSLGDLWSSCTIDLYLHRRYYDLVDPNHGILKKGREIFLTGCCLRTGMEGSDHQRLLPTEYLVILLDEEQDEDAMLLGAQFCSDSFSSISREAIESDASYSLYARIESIGPLEVQGKFGCSQRRQITLTDNDGVKLKFLLWGEQVLLANLFSIGSMLALDRPFIANAVDSNIEASEAFCLEYGSSTQLYLVPFICHEEQVLITSTQIRVHGSRMLSAPNQSQCLKVSQVTLPLDSQGSIDLKNYPFRSFVIDLRDKMTGISLYGVVIDLHREINTVEAIYSVEIEDLTGAIVAKLHFVRTWSLGRLGLGHTIYITGLTCCVTTGKLLEVSWFEKDPGASLVNLSCLPALLNSSCLHNLSRLCSLSNQTTNICSVRLHQIEHHHLNSRFLHSVCGHFINYRSDGLLECSLCHYACDDEVVRSFHLKVTLADESEEIFAWCTGQTAAELLQISPDEFYELHEDEQAMYLYTLENERFMVSIVSSKRQSDGSYNVIGEETEPGWEITRAQKCE